MICSEFWWQMLRIVYSERMYALFSGNVKEKRWEMQ